MPLFQNESPSKNDFDLHENDPVGETHFKGKYVNTAFI